MIYCRPQHRRRFCEISCSSYTVEEAIAPVTESKNSEDEHRVSRAELREDLHRLKAFRKTAPMSEGTFAKFSHVLRTV